MQKNVHSGLGQKTPYKYRHSKYSVKSTPSETENRYLSRKSSKVDNGIEGSVVLSKSEGSETDNAGQSDTCHSPTEDEVFSQANNFKAKSYARSLSTKIPTTKLSRRISKINKNKDR